MFTKEQSKLALKGIEVQDGLAVLQIIRRLVRSGVMEDVELAPLTILRSRLIKQIQEATGVNYDVAVAQAMQRGVSVPASEVAHAASVMNEKRLAAE
jgi:hypothetical protein